MMSRLAMLSSVAVLSTIVGGCNSTERDTAQDAPSGRVATAAPTPDASPEITSAGVNIQLAPSNGSNLYESGRSIEDDSRAVEVVAQKFPLPTRITTYLTNDYHDDRAEGDTIYIGRNRVRQETMQFEVAHELSHLLDAETNGDFLGRFFTPEQLATLRALRDDVLSDPTWGRDYPSVERIIGGKAGANILPREDDTPAEVAAGSDIDADGLWIEGKGSRAEPGFNPFESDLQASYDYLAQAEVNWTDFESFESFVANNSEVVDNFFNASALARYAREDFYHHLSSGLFNWENTAWTAQTDIAYLVGRFPDDLKEILVRLTHMILFEKYEAGELDVLVSTFPEGKPAFLEKAFESKFYGTDSEKFAQVLAIAAMIDIPNPGRMYLQTIAGFNVDNGTCVSGGCQAQETPIRP